MASFTTRLFELKVKTELPTVVVSCSALLRIGGASNHNQHSKISAESSAAMVSSMARIISQEFTILATDVESLLL